MDPGVGEQVGQHLVQSGLVARHDDGLGGSVQTPPVAGPGGVGVADGVGAQPGQVHRCTLQRTPGIQPGQQQQVLHQVGHPLRLGLHPTHRVRDILRQRGRITLRQFGIAADRRQRGAQFVAGVGDELPDPALAGLPGRQCGGDVVEHPVERQAEPADLGVGVGVGNPHRQPHLAPVQRKLRDGAGGGDHPVQRRQRAADDQQPGDHRDGDRQHREHREDQRHPAQGAGDVGHAQTDDQRAARVAAGHRQHAVATEAVQRPGHRTADVVEPGQLPAGGLGDRGAVTAAAQHTGHHAAVVAHHRGDHADRLARGVEEHRTGPGPHRRVHGSHRGRRAAFHHRGALRDLTQLVVEFTDQVAVQRQFGHTGDADTQRRQQRHLTGQQPRLQRPPAPVTAPA